MDITVRKHAEIRREESERRFRELFEAMADAILVTGPHGNIQDSNPAADAMFGASKAEMVGINVRKFVDGEQRPNLERYLETLQVGAPAFESPEVAIRGPGERQGDI